MMLLFVTACANGQPATVATECTAFAPIRPAVEDIDAISAGLAAQILAHNRTGQRVCGWVP